jgi:UTP-glucose-1-phosphate uridylyltransferase
MLPVRPSHIAKDPSDVMLIVEKQVEEWSREHIRLTENREIDSTEGMIDLVKNEEFIDIFFEGKHYDIFAHIIIVD